MLILSVTQPCHEKWEEMTPADRGAFCQSCSKHVVDFTAMADEDILDYFKKREGQPVCGRFRNTQLNRPLIEISPSVFSMDIPLWKKFLAAVFICFSAFITGCSAPGERDYTALQVPPTIELPVTPQKEIVTIKTDPIIPEQQPTKTNKKLKKKGKQKYRISNSAWIEYTPTEIVLPKNISWVTLGFTTSTPIIYNTQAPLPVVFPDLKKINVH
jgi:hypothetical protein